MKKNEKLRRWEMAMALSLCLTLCHGFAFQGVQVGWWGVIFPGLANTGAPEAVETLAIETESGVELRFRVLDWLAELRKR